MSRYYYVFNSTVQKNSLTAERYMLRESGDWKGYMTLADSGAIHTTPFLRGMVQFYAESLKSFEKISPLPEGLLVALSVWNDEYLDRFLNFCLPSLLEEKNIQALKRKKAILFIHTNAHGKEKILNHPILQPFIDHGITVQMMMLNDGLLEDIPFHAANKYWHLGLTQSLHLQYAKALNVDYHLLMPDVMYGAGFFERLINLKKPVITHSSIPTDANTIGKALENYRDGMSIKISPEDLISLSILHAHDRIKPYFVGKNKKFPKGHLLIFEGKDQIHLMSPHETLAYISKEVIEKIPDRFFFTLDSEIEKIVGQTPIYTPMAADGLAMLEISGNVPSTPRSEVEDSEEYCTRFISHIPEKGQQKLFMQSMTMPLNRNMMGDRWYMEEEEIESMKKEIRIILSKNG